jgi:hypothetical protein
MPKSTQQFQTIRTEGALLPPDILQRIASLKVDGVRPADYHLPEGFRINDAITQSWDILKKHWKNFQEAREQLSESEHGTSITNERWLLPLFKELEYGRLSTSPSPQIEDRSYPIERFYNHTPIHLIGCNLPMDRRTKGARGSATSSPHSMMQEFLNRSDQHQWGFLSNGRQLRILRDNVSLSRQAYLEFDLEGMMDGEVYGDFVLLWLLCHQSRVEADHVDDCWLEKWSKLAREEGTRVLNNLRTGVTRAIELLGQGFIAHPHNDELRSKLQESGTLTRDDFYRQLLRIVYRLLFLFVAEDRRLLHPPDADKKACELYDTYYSTRRLREMAFKLRGSKHTDLWHSLSLIFHGLHRDNGLPELGLPALGSFLWAPPKTADLLGPAQIVSAIPSAPDKGERAKMRASTELQPPVFISNDDLLAAIRALAYVTQDNVLRDVDYRNLDTEEFGSVYESLLELHPVMHVEAKTFSLNTASGNERKTSGSYYTPDSLVQCLLDSALDPVIAERLKGLKGKEAEDAILNIKVCDPACGSGHFLIGAARRLARHLARIRTGESEPSPEDYQHALRDVISHCIYGVDINPMSVELCKVALWMEAMEPGKPLSFLDHHIQCGNSLLGTTPALLAKGIPDEAFTPIEGDVKARVTSLKKQNKSERPLESGKRQRLLGDVPFKLGNMAADFARLNSAPDGTLAEVAEAQEQYARLVHSSEYESTQLLADTWCAAFVWKKDDSDLGKMCPTERDFRKVETHAGAGLLPHVRQEVERLRDQYQFFHWHLAFPNVFRLPGKDETPENEQTGWSGGFDIVLGNPPWETIKLQDREWFATRRPDISNAANTSARDRLIEELDVQDPVLAKSYREAKRFAAGSARLISSDSRFPMCSCGDLNTFAIFAELGRIIASPCGYQGCILPTGIVTDDPYKFFFQDVLLTKSLVSVFDFENQKPHFPDVKRTTKFCLFTAFGRNSKRTCETPKFFFFGYDIPDLADVERRFSLSPETITRINPNTKTCPIFRTNRDAMITGLVHDAHDVLVRDGDDGENPWKIDLTTVFHMSGDSGLFRFLAQICDDPCMLVGNQVTTADTKWIPLYEQNLFHAYDHRFATYASANESPSSTVSEYLTENDHNDPSVLAIPRYWVTEDDLTKRWTQKGIQRDWTLAFRQSARTVDSRTGIFCVLPKVASGHSVHIAEVRLDDPRMSCARLAEWNSFGWDYLFRQSLGGNNTSFFVVKQVAAVSPSIICGQAAWSNTTNLAWLLPRVLELTYTAWDLEPFARDCGYAGPPFRWDEERRFLLRAELDAAFFHLYGLNRDDTAYILDTFPIVRRKDIARTEIKNQSGEVTQPGTYITKDTILTIYDAMQTAIDTGTPYQTRLNPPPADPRVAHPPKG